MTFFQINFYWSSHITDTGVVKTEFNKKYLEMYISKMYQFIRLFHWRKMEEWNCLSYKPKFKPGCMRLYMYNKTQEGYIEELSRFSQCLNAKTGFVAFWSVYKSFLFWIFLFQIVHLQKILEGQCLNKNRLTAPQYILLGLT